MRHARMRPCFCNAGNAVASDVHPLSSALRITCGARVLYIFLYYIEEIVVGNKLLFFSATLNCFGCSLKDSACPQVYAWETFQAHSAMLFDCSARTHMYGGIYRLQPFDCLPRFVQFCVHTYTTENSEDR